MPSGAVVGDLDLVPVELQRLAQALGRVDVVLDDEHAAARSAGALGAAQVRPRRLLARRAASAP